MPEWLTPGCNRRVVSRTYVVAAWLGLAAGLVAWPAFAVAGAAFYAAAIVLRREGM